MEHNFKPILLIDDKKEGEFRGDIFKKALSIDLQNLVDFHLNVDQLIKRINTWEVELLFDPDKYAGIFLHQSYYDHLLNESQLSNLKYQLSDFNLITFSGGKQVNAVTNELSRDVLYTYLKDAIDAYFKMGIFPTSYLFGGKINRFYPIIDEMYQVLEDKGVDALLEHKSFNIYISNIRNLDLYLVQKHYKEQLSEEQIAYKISEWRQNFNQ